MIYEPDDMLSPMQAAVVLNCGEGYVRDLCRRGALAHTVNGRGQQRKRYRIRYQALRDYQQQQERDSIAGHQTAMGLRQVDAPQESAFLYAKRRGGRNRGPH